MCWMQFSSSAKRGRTVKSKKKSSEPLNLKQPAKQDKASNKNNRHSVKLANVGCLWTWG